MKKKTKIALWFDSDDLAKLKAISAKTGAAVSELIRRAVKASLKRRKVLAFGAVLLLLGVQAQADGNGRVVRVAQTNTRPHTTHVLVCTVDADKLQLRILLACDSHFPSCVQPLAGKDGVMEDLDPNVIYEGQNARVEWINHGEDNVVGAYQVQSSSAERCQVSR